jgi:hypothetical protein
MNVRNKHLAHSLTKTNLEAAMASKKKRVAPMKYGYERKLLFKSLPIVEVLHRGINGAGFSSFARSQEAARTRRQAVWATGWEPLLRAKAI